MIKKRYLVVALAAMVLAGGYAIPEPRVIPVSGATEADWNKDTFWYEPWGSSGVHKGIDIFARKGADVIAPTNVLVVYRGQFGKGGKVIVALGPKWRLHYFAHLDQIEEGAGRIVPAETVLGAVGDSGNAKGKQAHLHYSIVSLLPRLWAMDNSTHGYKKAFFINPITSLRQ